MTINELLERLKNLTRYDANIYGPMIEMEKELDGNYIYYEDLEELINEFEHKQ
jgi:hypothetical protein